MIQKLTLSFAMVLILSIGCDGTPDPANEVLPQSFAVFQQHLATGKLCPGGPAEVWGYPIIDSSFPAAAGSVEQDGPKPPFVAKIPFWCRPFSSPNRVIKANAKVDLGLSNGHLAVTQFQVEDLGTLTLGEQAWRWIVVFVGSQLIVSFLIFMFLNLNLEWSVLIAGICSLPIGGWVSYVVFRGALAVVICLVIQVALSGICIAAVTRFAERR
jgi:hypothetical protein